MKSIFDQFKSDHFGFDDEEDEEDSKEENLPFNNFLSVSSSNIERKRDREENRFIQFTGEGRKDNLVNKFYCFISKGEIKNIQNILNQTSPYFYSK